MRCSAKLMSFVALVASAAALAGAEEPTHEYFTASDGVKIHYMQLGAEGSYVVLIHGYTDTAQRMWFTTGVAQALAANHRVVALDNRNHGLSDKPQPNGSGRAQDVIELMDLLKIEKAHIHGYSMGGSITGQLLASNPERFITAAFGGSGIRETDPEMREKAAALDPEMPEPQGAEAAAFQRLRARSAARRSAGAEGSAEGSAESSGARPAAAARVRRGAPIDLAKVTVPVLAINGEFDRPYSKTLRMWRELNNFRNVVLPGKNHMSAIAVGGPMPQAYTDSLVEFINAHDVK